MNLKRISQLLIALGAAAALAVSPALASTAFQLSGQGPTEWTTSGTWNLNPGAWDGIVNSTRTVTNQLPSGTTVSFSATGTVSVASRYKNNSGYMKLSDHGGQDSDYVAGTSATLPAVAVTNFCKNPQQGYSSDFLLDSSSDPYCNMNTLVENRGELTVTFSRPVTNPVLNFSGIGGYDWRWQGGTANSPTYENYMRLWTEFELLTPNTSMTMLTTNGQYLLSADANGGANRVLKPVSDGSTISSYCNNSNTNWLGGCASIRLNGTGTSFTFSLDYRSIGGVSGVNGLTNRTTDDTFIVSVSVADDYGSGPASYDTSATYHTVGDLFMGAGVTPDALAALTPARDASGDTEASSTFRALPSGAPMPGAVGSNYSVIVPVTATAAGKVCGWVDWNNNGTYDTAERQCATFASGTANKTLTWAVPVGFNATATWMRLRASYDTTGVEYPVGPLNSGEVEDYQLGVALAVDSPTLANTGMRDSSGLIIVAAMVAMAGGATYLASMVTSRPRRRNEH